MTTTPRPRPRCAAAPPAAASLAALPALLICAGLGAQATISVVTPGDRDRLEGSSSTIYPLGRHDTRFQQLVLDAGRLTTVKGLAWRRDALGPRDAVGAFRSNLEITCSTTTVRPDAIHTTFKDNVGTAARVVLPRTAVSFPPTVRPAQPTGAFAYQVPFGSPYVWSGAQTLCVDLTIAGNQAPNGPDTNFNPGLDAHELFASGRNDQPGYPFGTGCKARGSTREARCAFELRHLGQRLDLRIESSDGVPSTGAGRAGSLLLLSLAPQSVPWPPGSGCTLYGAPTVIVPLPGDNTSGGDWTGTLAAGTPPAPFVEVVAQILSAAPSSGEVVLSDASRLIAPPPGVGVVSSRVVNASDRTAASGSVSFVVPVLGLF